MSHTTILGVALFLLLSTSRAFQTNFGRSSKVSRVYFQSEAGQETEIREEVYTSRQQQQWWAPLRIRRRSRVISDLNSKEQRRQGRQETANVGQRRRQRIIRFQLKRNRNMNSTKSLIETADSEESDKRRISFRSRNGSEKMIQVTDRDLFRRYMTQPPESYSLLSHHYDNDVKSDTRRWIVRRLSADESYPYRMKAEKMFEECSSSNKPLHDQQHVRKEMMNEGNYFRLAVPLEPLIGIKLTPVVDLVVSSKQSSQNTATTSKGKIAFRSVRVALLSTIDEVNAAMMSQSNNNTRPRWAPRKVLQRKHSSTPKSNLQEMGSQAVATANKLEEFIQPHMDFAASITWNDGSDNRFKRNDMGTVRISTETTTSLYIPKNLPVNVPAVALKRFGSILTERGIALLLPRFLQQLEKDFNRWSVDSDDTT